jgi:hypothetical protein
VHYWGEQVSSLKCLGYENSRVLEKNRFHLMQGFRQLNIGDIDYILVTKDIEKVGFLPPGDFDEGFFHLLRTFPKNLIQLNDPIEYFGRIGFIRQQNPLRFSVLYEHDVEAHLQVDILKDAVKVVFISQHIQNAGDLIKRLRSHYKLVFFIVSSDSKILSKQGEGICKDAYGLLNEFKQNHAEVERMVNLVYKKGDFKLKINLNNGGGEEFNPPVYFRPAQVNYFTLNQAIGNYWYSYNGDIQTEVIEESKKAAKSGTNDITRFKMLMDTVDRIDSLELNHFKQNKVKLPSPNSLIYKPLILVSSYNYPHLSDFFEARLKKDKKLNIIIKSLGFEQRLNYTNYFEASDEATEHETIETIQAVGQLQSHKHHYLDGVSYLHASFNGSPTIRLPFIGNKIKKELSFFRPEVAIRNLRSLKKLIDRFGRKLLKSTIPIEFTEKIFTRPRQIVSITDLPIEWLNVGGLPLALTHDVTRMPEHPMSGLMAYNAVNTYFKFDITKDILKETLVLFCASSEDENYETFLFFYENIRELSKELEFKTFICKSVDEVARLVNEHRPNLLIFDCHGHYDTDSLSSYLVINKERLDGAGIVKNRISAPIVFLSACFTNPTYGYVNGIANAFFEAGSLAVTATYFPISISA